MNIILTGNMGWIGGKLMDRLKGAHHIEAFDSINYSSFRWQFEQIKNDGRDYDLLIHCGAISDSVAVGNNLWEMNYKATCELGDFCEERNMKMLFISSCAAIDPDTPYGWSKHCAEFYLNHKVMGLHLCILRPYNIWGFDEGNKISPSIIYRMMTGELPVIYKGCERDFVFVDDVVHSICRLVTDWQPGTFEIGSGIATEIETLFTVLFDDSFFRYSSCHVIFDCPIKRSLKANRDNLIPGHPRPQDVTDYIDQIKNIIKGNVYYGQDENKSC